MRLTLAKYKAQNTLFLSMYFEFGLTIFILQIIFKLVVPHHFFDNEKKVKLTIARYLYTFSRQFPTPPTLYLTMVRFKVPN